MSLTSRVDQNGVCKVNVARRLVFLYSVLCVYRAACYMYFLVARYKRLRIGRCVFWGPREFLDLCGKSAEELRSLDEKLYDELFARRILFYSAPGTSRTQLHTMTSSFSVPNEYCAWQEQGIISVFVHTFFLTHPEVIDAFIKLDQPKLRTLSSDAKAHTQFWLAKAGFSEKLIRHFD